MQRRETPRSAWWSHQVKKIATLVPLSDNKYAAIKEVIPSTTSSCLTRTYPSSKSPSSHKSTDFIISHDVSGSTVPKNREVFKVQWLLFHEKYSERNISDFISTAKVIWASHFYHLLCTFYSSKYIHPAEAYLHYFDVQTSEYHWAFEGTRAIQP